MPNDATVLTPSTVQPASGERTVVREFRRDDSLDIAKGFGILLVVLGHCLDGLRDSSFFPASEIWPLAVVVFIYTFHMPLFFVVSGHLASGKHRPAGATIKKLLPSIVYPYFLWSIVQCLVQYEMSSYTNTRISLTVLYKILWSPIVPYWFLYSLFFCHLGYLLIRKLPRAAQLAIAIAVFLTPLFFFDFLIQHPLQIVPQTVRGFLYYVLGVVSVSQVKQFGRWTAIASTVLFFLFTTICFQAQWTGPTEAVTELPAAIAGIVATLAWSRLAAARPGPIVRLFSFLGRYSMSIYVLHIFFTAGIRIALKRAGLASHTHPSATAVAVEILAATVIGTAAPLAINWVVSRFHLDKWFGLQHMETSRA